jgi:NADPH:quinone reductase-like Zn-dependent oxidoreductase
MSDLITAIVQTEQSTLQLTKIPKPKPGPKELLVKVSHAAQNPTDGNNLTLLSLVLSHVIIAKISR